MIKIEREFFYDKEKNILSRVTVEDIRKFGMIPEFIGRLPITVTLEGLNRDMMIRILKEPKNAILRQYQKLLALRSYSWMAPETQYTASLSLRRTGGERLG